MIKVVLGPLVAIIATTAATIIFYTLAKLFGAKLPSKWRILNIGLTPIRWVYFTVAGFALIFMISFVYMTIVEPISEYAELKYKESRVAARDESRFSILVTTFSGPDGEHQAHLVATRLHKLLGPGVQVLQVPFVPTSSDHSDISDEEHASEKRAAKCASEYNGDVVIWGDYYESSRILTLSYSIKGDRCLFPECGVYTSSNVSSSYLTDEIAVEGSPLAKSFLSIASEAAAMPIFLAQKSPAKEICLSNLHFVETYARKTDNLLNGIPKTTDPENLAWLSISDGLYNLYREQLSKRPNSYAERAVRAFVQARTLDVTAEERTSLAYATVLVDSSRYSTSLSDRQTAAGIVAKLISPHDEMEQFSMAMLRGDAWSLVYEKSHQNSDYDLAEEAYRRARELARSDADIILSDVTLALTYFDQGGRHNLSDYSSVSHSVDEAANVYMRWPQERRDSLNLDQTYGLLTVQLRMSVLKADPVLVNKWLAYNEKDRRLAVSNWFDIRYLALVEARERASFFIFETSGNPILADDASNSLDAMANHVADRRLAAGFRDEAAKLSERAIEDLARSPRTQSRRQCLAISHIYARAGKSDLARGC